MMSALSGIINSKMAVSAAMMTSRTIHSMMDASTSSMMISIIHSMMDEKVTTRSSAIHSMMDASTSTLTRDTKSFGSLKVDNLSTELFVECDPNTCAKAEENSHPSELPKDDHVRIFVASPHADKLINRVPSTGADCMSPTSAKVQNQTSRI